MRLFRGRWIGYGQRVFVYRNLHEACWSVRALAGPFKGLVIAHTDSIALSEARFRVSEAGRQRVLRERRKNVHAGIVGEYIPGEDWYGRLDTWVRYSPFEAGAFIADGVAPVKSAVQVYLDADGRVHAAGCQRL